MKHDEREKGGADSESAMYLKQIYTLQNYVSDYVQYRVHLHDGRYPQVPEVQRQTDDEYELMRAVALIFEKKHVEELRDMVTALCGDGRLSFQRYVEVVEHFARNDDESTAQMSYGRLVALTAFAGLVATRLCDMHLFSEISLIAMYTSKFLQKRISLTWQRDERSWERFFDLAKTIIKMNDEEEESERIRSESQSAECWWRPSIGALAFFGILGIGIFTIMKTMLRAR